MWDAVTEGTSDEHRRGHAPVSKECGPQNIRGSLVPSLSRARGHQSGLWVTTEGGTQEPGAVDRMAPWRRLELVLLCIYVAFENRHVIIFSVVETFLMPK